MNINNSYKVPTSINQQPFAVCAMTVHNALELESDTPIWIFDDSEDAVEM